jgi:hypothetical protein
VFSASVKDGLGNLLHKKLFVMMTASDGTIRLRQPTIFHDLALAPAGVDIPDGTSLPELSDIEEALIEKGLAPFLDEISAQREKETEVIGRHIDISLNETIHRQNLKLMELVEQQDRGDTTPLLSANIKQCEDRIEELAGRLERRQGELARERQCTIGDIHHLASAWVLPHPERTSPGIAPMVRDDEVEKIAVEIVTAYEEARGWVVESVEKENRGFDLISRKPHPEDSKTFTELRFIEVKGRAGVGEVALTSNEYKTAERLKNDYWLYVVFNCAATAELHTIQNPVTLGWEPLIKVEHYHVRAQEILKFSM